MSSKMRGVMIARMVHTARGRSNRGYNHKEYAAAVAHIEVQRLIDNYQSKGHLVTNLDPLGLQEREKPDELDIGKYKLGPKDMDRLFLLPPTTHVGHGEKALPLREIVKRLESTYCGSLGIEYRHIVNSEQRIWICQRVEASPREFSTEERKVLLKQLIRVTKLEEFLAKKWPNEKRFGAEGCEVLIPALQRLINRSQSYSVQSVSVGMAHRGRLNVIANVCNQPLPLLFTQFMDLELRDEGTGDVKYHIGCSVDNRPAGGVKISMLSNPSHLEFNPVLMGKVMAEAFHSGDTRGDRHLALVVHGDAAFAGQGVAMESLQLSNLPNYTVHGAVHVMVNNQIGFTTEPRDLQSSVYCTDVAKLLPDCPVLHVNGSDPEAVMHACDIAADWRARFLSDVMVDIVCYRLHGHNELDEPSFTRPRMYQRIREMKPLHEQYKQRIVDEPSIGDAFVQKTSEFEQLLEADFEEARSIDGKYISQWTAIPTEDFYANRVNLPGSGIDRAVLERVAGAFTTVPEGFALHKGLERVIKGREEMLRSDSFDWAIGEALAFGSLAMQGIHVRVCGQDTERGTFSHRHHVLHDIKAEGETYCQLQHLSPDQAPYVIGNSLLSESAALGFELGYSMVTSKALVVWEAQFGDFANNAQCVIDQYLAAGESKWGVQTGIVLLLPHGYEGMGSEHSSARLERFLQLSDVDDGPSFEALIKDETDQLRKANMIVANCTTPANLFHLLRRQMVLPFRKPAVLMTPKSLLRHPKVRSSSQAFLPGTSFKRLIEEAGVSSGDPTSVKRLIFCSGKTYYDIIEAREEAGLQGEIAVSRVEQLSPFPYDLARSECAKYENAQVVWAQEEHKNMGAWSFVSPRLSSVSQGRSVLYAGRSPSASPAVGSKRGHLKEQKSYIAGLIKM